MHYKMHPSTVDIGYTGRQVDKWWYWMFSHARIRRHNGQNDAQPPGNTGTIARGYVMSKSQSRWTHAAAAADKNRPESPDRLDIAGFSLPWSRDPSTNSSEPATSLYFRYVINYWFSACFTILTVKSVTTKTNWSFIWYATSNYTHSEVKYQFWIRV